MEDKVIRPPIQPIFKDSFDMGVSRIKLSYTTDSVLLRPYNRVTQEHSLLLSQNLVV